MEDLTKWSDDDVFGKAGEQPGSQMAYWRQIEIERRKNVLEKDLLRSQIDAVTTQKAAAREAERQARYLFWSTVAAAVSAVGALITAIITYVVAK